MMKPKYFFLGAALALLLWGCDNDDNPDFGEPFSKVAGISDEWELIEMGHVGFELEGNLVANSIALPQSFVGDVPATLTFTSDYSYTGSAHSSAILFPTSGTWAFDDEQYPSKVILNSGGQRLELDLLSPVRENVDPYLHFRYTRPFKDGCVPDGATSTGAVGYEYKFKRK